jgi:GntR family transcriptional regulator, arabinose operon transcriptional repressor
MMINLKRNGDTPLYEQLSEIFLQQIVDQKWGAGDHQLPTEPELCEMYGVARGTVRQALAKLELQGYVRRERGRGTFINHVDDVAPPKTLEQQIGFIVPYIRGSFVTNILDGIERAASEHHWSLIFRHVENDLEKQKKAINDLAASNLAGIVLYPINSTNAEAIQPFVKSQYPMVLVDRYLRGVDTDYVMSDNFGGAMKAMQHLIYLGHKRIGFVTWRDDAVSMAHRRQGYQQMMREAGLDWDDSMCCEINGYPEFDMEPLYDFLQQRPSLTAIFAANDPIALAIYRAMEKLNLRVPDDIAIVGFGNHDVGEHINSPLTTVSMPAFEIGYTAAKLLIQRCQDEDRDIQRIILPTELIIRKSCGSM